MTPTNTITLPVLYVIRFMDDRGKWETYTEATRNDADDCFDAVGEEHTRRQLWHGEDFLKDQVWIEDDDHEDGGVWGDCEE